MTVEEVEVRACPDPELARDMREELLRSVLEAVASKAPKKRNGGPAATALAAAALKVFEEVPQGGSRDVQEVEIEV